MLRGGTSCLRSCLSRDAEILVLFGYLLLSMLYEWQQERVHLTDYLIPLV